MSLFISHLRRKGDLPLQANLCTEFVVVESIPGTFHVRARWWGFESKLSLVAS